MCIRDRAIKAETKLIYSEVFANPTLNIADIPTLADIAHKNGALLMIDNTFSTPIAIKPIKFGADIVINSLTKFMNGHSDAIAGSITSTTEIIDAIHPVRMLYGTPGDPHAAHAMMKSFAKILGVPQEILRAKYFGLNHFGWFTDLYGTDGKNYFDQLRTYLRDHEFKPYNAEQRSKSWLETYVRVNKYMQYLDEYVPTTYLQYYMFPDEIVKESDPNYTRADEAKDSREKDVFETCAKAVGRDTMDPSEMLTNSVFGNLMVEVAESIAYDLNNEFVVLVRNEGIIPNFESRAIIEVAGTIGKDGAKGYPYGDIDPYYKGLMEGQYAYEQLTVEAFREKSYTKALKALILNRSVIDPSKAGAVLDDLMEANKDYWYLT